MTRNTRLKVHLVAIHKLCNIILKLLTPSPFPFCPRITPMQTATLPCLGYIIFEQPIFSSWGQCYPFLRTYIHSIGKIYICGLFCNSQFFIRKTIELCNDVKRSVKLVILAPVWVSVFVYPTKGLWQPSSCLFYTLLYPIWCQTGLKQRTTELYTMRQLHTVRKRKEEWKQEQMYAKQQK
jgi:hypothetical protein